MEITFRPAVPGDAPALHRLNAAFNGETGATPDSIRRSLLVSPEIVVIAECGGSPAGFCCAQVHSSFCYPAPVAEVAEMFVAEAFRRRGCATGMLAFLESLLRREHGVDEMHLLTGLRNQAARETYRRSGFIPREEAYMVKRLE